MTITSAKRKRMEKLIYDVMTALDPTEVNTEKYQKKFKGMTNEKFDKYFKKFLASDDTHFYLDVVDYERDLGMEHVEKAAKILDTKLMDYIAMPMVDGNTKNPVISKHPVPVGYLPTKRLQQLVSKKNTTSTNIDQRSPLIGQVTRDDKNARDSDAENFALATLDANKTLEEFMSVRSDDMVKKREMYGDIARKGYANLTGLTNSPDNKVTLNTINVYFLGMGVRTDLVNDGLVLSSTLNDKDIK